MQMEKKIVGGGQGGMNVLEDSEGTENRMTFKAKREKNIQLKNKRDLKKKEAAEAAEREEQEEAMLLADDVNDREVENADSSAQ